MTKSENVMCLFLIVTATVSALLHLLELTIVCTGMVVAFNLEVLINTIRDKK
jgi:hypothetical protein